MSISDEATVGDRCEGITAMHLYNRKYIFRKGMKPKGDLIFSSPISPLFPACKALAYQNYNW